MHEIAARGRGGARLAFMIDQCHNVEGKIDAMIQSVMNIQTAYAKALLIDDAVLTTAQAEGDVLGAHRALTEAFETDVRPLLARRRADKRLDPDPVPDVSGTAVTRSTERASAGSAPVESAYEKL